MRIDRLFFWSFVEDEDEDEEEDDDDDDDDVGHG